MNALEYMMKEYKDIPLEKMRSVVSAEQCSAVPGALTAAGAGNGLLTVSGAMQSCGSGCVSMLKLIGLRSRGLISHSWLLHHALAPVST